MSVQPASQQVFVPVQAGSPLHVDVHLEFTQLDPYGQEYSQPPQLFGSLVVSAHPFQQHVCEPLQADPPLHVNVHCEFTQLEPDGQSIVQPPQLFRSFVGSTHVLLQRIRGGEQTASAQPLPELE